MIKKQALNLGRAFTVAMGVTGAVGVLPTLAECWQTRASWYGPGFDGKPTASEEIFNEDDLTAAHRTLPFGTRLEVTNLNNGKSVTVRINDRGPFHGNRGLDLSKGAATRIGMIDNGVVPTEICPA